MTGKVPAYAGRMGAVNPSRLTSAAGLPRLRGESLCIVLGFGLMENGVFLLVLIVPLILLVPSLAEWVGRTVGRSDLARGVSSALRDDLTVTCPGCGRSLTSSASPCPHCTHPVAVQGGPSPGGALVDRPWMPLLVTLLLPIFLFLLSAIVLVFLLGGMPGVGGTGG